MPKPLSNPDDLSVSNHAVEQLRVRAPWLGTARPDLVRRRIRSMYRKGVVFGGQCGPDYSLLCQYENTNHEFVLVCTVNDGTQHVVKTVLTKDFAVANILRRKSARKAYAA